MLQTIQDERRRHSPGQTAATKLWVGLHLDFEFSAADRAGRSAGDKGALMHNAQAEASRRKLFVGTKGIDKGGGKVRRELRHLCQTHLPQLKPGG